MAARIAAQLTEPILFAHRGGAAHAPENTMEAFTLGMRLGANGLESDVWLSQDGVPVLIHDDVLGSSMRKRRVGDTPAADLPAHVPSLAHLLGEIGSATFVSLDMKTPDAAPATVDTMRAASESSGVDLVSHTWICHPDMELLASWRRRWSDVRLVHSTRRARVAVGPERHGAMLAERKIDAVNFPQGDWSGGMTTMYHRFGVLCFGWDAHLERVSAELLDLGCDAIYSDHVDRMLSARRTVYGF